LETCATASRGESRKSSRLVKIPADTDRLETCATASPQALVHVKYPASARATGKLAAVLRNSLIRLLHSKFVGDP